MIELPLPIEKAKPLDLITTLLKFPTLESHRVELNELANSRSGMIPSGVVALLETISTLIQCKHDLANIRVRELHKLAKDRHNTCTNLTGVLEIRAIFVASNTASVSMTTKKSLVSYYIHTRCKYVLDEERAKWIRMNSTTLAKLSFIENERLPTSKNIGMYETIIAYLLARIDHRELTLESLAKEVKHNCNIKISNSTATEVKEFFK